MQHNCASEQDIQNRSQTMILKTFTAIFAFAFQMVLYFPFDFQRVWPVPVFRKLSTLAILPYFIIFVLHLGTMVLWVWVMQGF